LSFHLLYRKQLLPQLLVESIISAHSARSSGFAIFHPKSFRRATYRIDELPLLGGKDLVDYRRMLQKNLSRHFAALNLAVERIGQWDKPMGNGIFKAVTVHAAMGVKFPRL
jgi:hypothetical protein